MNKELPTIYDDELLKINGGRGMSEYAIREFISKRFKYEGLNIYIEQGGYGPHLHIDQKTLDSDNIEKEISISTIFEIPSIIQDENHLIFWLWKCVQERVLHEAAEFFKVDGIKLFNPHKEEK